MTDIDLAELDRLLVAAPERLYLLGAPWSTNTGPPVILVGSDDPHATDIILCGQDIDEWPADERGPDYTRQDRYAELAVAAVNALPALLARLRAAEERIALLLDLKHRAQLAVDQVYQEARAAEARVAELLDENVRYWTALADLLIGAQQQSQSHADVIAVVVEATKSEEGGHERAWTVGRSGGR